MKTAKENKSAKTTKNSSSPFFNKSGDQSFFAPKPENPSPFFNVQPKLSIGQSNDKFEKEADQVADKIVSPDNKKTSAPDIQAKCNSCENEESVDRKEEITEEETTVQAKLHSPAPQPETNSFESRLKSNPSQGTPLAPGVKKEMESGFGSSLSNVRIHNDSNAESMNKEINAQAFTHGNDIYFNQGKYNPTQQTGKHLLAHELTHVIQQNGPVAPKPQKEINTPVPIPTPPATPELQQNTEESSNEKTNITPASNITNSQITTTLNGNSQDQGSINQVPSTTSTPSENTATIPDLNDSAIDPTAESFVTPTIASSTSSGNEAIPEPAEIQIEAQTSEGLLNTLSSASPTGFIQGMQQADEVVNQIQSQEKSDLQTSLPEITQPTGLPIQSRQNPEVQTSLNSNSSLDLSTTGNQEGQNIEENHPQPVTPVEVSNISTPRSQGEDDPNFETNIRRATSQIRTSDPSLNTSAGIRPTVDLNGAANPQQNNTNQLQSDQEVTQQNLAANQLSNQDFGENNIYPQIQELQTLRPQNNLSEAPLRTGPNIELPPNARPEVLSAFNNQGRDQLDEKMSEQMSRHETERLKMQEDSEQERLRGQEEINAETLRIRAQQESAQMNARGEVEGYQQQWQEENQAVQEEYSSQSSERRAEIDSQIETEVESTNEQVDQELTQAEDNAEEARISTEQEAHEQQQEAQREQENAGFWDRVASAVSNFFDRLREGLNALFNRLRQAVAAMIERAKRAVNRLIDMARDAVVRLIEGFGEVLKGLVNIALSAYPEIAERINGYIDSAVDVAVDTVNTLAEGLKEIASSILDALGSALDFILSAYQAIFNLILDVMEFVMVGLIEVIKGISNLVEAAYNMPDYFWGQMSEELLGFDLSQPLPGIERTSPQGSSTNINGQQVDLPTEDAQLLGQSRLARRNVEVDPLQELDFGPEFFASLGIIGNGEQEFGEPGSDDVTFDEIRSSVLEQTDLGGEEPAGSGGELEFDPNWDDERKLQYYIDQMGDQDCSDAETPNAGGEPEQSPPDEAKVGPLTIGQRSDFILGQMRAGMENWWECNKVMVISITIGVLLALGIATILTGGAVLALLPPLITAMTYLFMAWLAARMGWYFGGYLEKGWGGDIAGGAKDLARAFAVGIVELVFNLIFKAGGLILAAIRKVIAAMTRIASAVGRGVIRAGRGIGRGMMRGGRFVARGVSRYGGAAGRYVVRQGKVIFQGVQRGFGRGVRNLRDLGRRLKNWFRFRGFSIEIKGQRFFLYGHFNPRKIMLGSGRVKDLTPDEASRVRAQGSDSRMLGELLNSGGNRAIVVSDDFARTFQQWSPARRSSFLNDLAGKTDDEISAFIRSIRDSGANSRHARELRQSLTAAGKTANPGDHAHHLIPSIHRLAEEARNILNRLNIGINSSPNGVFLNDALHAGLHTNAYINKVTAIIRRAEATGGRTAVLSALDNISSRVAAGTFI